MTVAGYTVKETMEAIRVAISAAEGVLVGYRDIASYMMMGHIYGEFAQAADVFDEEKDFLFKAGAVKYRINAIGQKYVWIRIAHPTVDAKGHIQPMISARVDRDSFILVWAFGIHEEATSAI
jgi:hypothetical protein